jgi:hypothetical protein
MVRACLCAGKLTLVIPPPTAARRAQIMAVA